MTENEDSSERLPAVAAVLREFFGDLIGSLIPGFLFTMFAVPLFVATGVVVFPRGFIWADISATFGSYYPEIVSLGLVLSYVLGSVFARLDPKFPDRKSATHILRKCWLELPRCVIQPVGDGPSLKGWRSALSHLSVLFERHFKAQMLARGEGGQFPYSHLYEYLIARKLDRLADHVPWRGDDVPVEARSKMFINILKIRLQFHVPRRCGIIRRNEDHIRMMSSMWFAAQHLEIMCVVLFIPLAAISFKRGLTYIHPNPPAPFVMATILVTVFAASQWVCSGIVRFLHYQRVREIVYVLETAHTAWMSGQRSMFEGLERIEPAEGANPAGH